MNGNACLSVCTWEPLDGRLVRGSDKQEKEKEGEKKTAAEAEITTIREADDTKSQHHLIRVRMIKLLLHSWSYFLFREMTKCNRCLESNEIQTCLVDLSWSVNRRGQSATPPPQAHNCSTLGPSLRVFYKTWPKSPFVSRCSSFINIKNDPVKLWRPLISDAAAA